MRSIHVAPWLGCVFGTVLAISLAVSPAAEAQNKNKKAKSVTRCVKYTQDTQDEGIYVELESSCKIDLECSVTWELRCDSDKKSNKRHGARAFMVMAGKSESMMASSAECGDDGWRINNIRWSCRSDDD